jgi:c-di-GMP-binding flagellar brake protein YcgR
MARSYVRKYPRVKVRLPVEYTAAGEDYLRAIATNLGGGGLFLAEVSDLEPEGIIGVRFRPARHIPLVEARASVRYIMAGLGVGVGFTEIREEDRQRVLRWIHQKTGDRRQQKRALLATQVQCEECRTLAFSRDISPGGMFIETSESLPPGSVITVRFNLNNKDKVVTARAHVTYEVEKMGMGILFEEIEPDDRDAIQAYVESMPPARLIEPWDSQAQP